MEKGEGGALEGLKQTHKQTHTDRRRMERVAQRHLCQAGHGDDVSGVEGHD